ncbi:hypothetical protein OG589_14700 [Sphaerisporangium sp. NBC_01403]|uniref:hypothetical protein n=1 Tax=Sphaerisporangium sp. NBC_01403 TaxID=2903599 RepID=UPI00324F85B6
MPNARLTPEDAIASALLRWNGGVDQHARPIARAALEALAGHGYMLIHVGTSNDQKRVAARLHGAERFLKTCAESLEAMSALNVARPADLQPSLEEGMAS